jgi:adenylyl cyclase-associated protein
MLQVSNKAAPVHVTEGSMKQEVYVFACRDAVVYIDSKVKNVRIDTCRDVVIFVHSALSGIEVVNCKKVKIQVQNSVPSVAIDKTDGIVVGLSFASRSAQLVTSKSSEMNVTFPVSEEAEADWVEQPIPEQFCSHITPAGKLTTTVSELYSS